MKTNPCLALPLALLASVAACTGQARADRLTYDSFAAEWGPGPAIEPKFEAICGCDLQWVTAGDGAALLARLRLEGAHTEADVVLGLDTSLTAAGGGDRAVRPTRRDAEVATTAGGLGRSGLRALRLGLFRLRLRPDQAGRPAAQLQANWRPRS